MPVEHIFTIQGQGGEPGPDGAREQDWASHKARVVEPRRLSASREAAPPGRPRGVSIGPRAVQRLRPLRR